MNLTTIQITFLRDIPKSINVDKTSGWKHHYFDALIEIPSFIKLIRDGNIYLLIPFVACSLSTPKLRLSEPFLVNNKSNPELIFKFILNQWQSSGFNIKDTSVLYFSFEFKEVWFSDN